MTETKFTIEGLDIDGQPLPTVSLGKIPTEPQQNDPYFGTLLSVRRIQAGERVKVEDVEELVISIITDMLSGKNFILHPDSGSTLPEWVKTRLLTAEFQMKYTTRIIKHLEKNALILS